MTDEELFRRKLKVHPGEGVVTLGYSRPTWVGLSYEEFFKSHGWILGATGKGKSFAMLAILYQIIRDTNFPVLWLDMKSELTDLMTGIFLPALSTLVDGIPNEIRMVSPFDKTYMPMLRITAPEEGVSHEVQAFNLAKSLEQALGSELGGRMTRVFLHLSLLAIELNLPLTILKTWVEQPQTFVRAARKSKSRVVQSYAANYTTRENKASVEALLARLDSFLFLGSTRQALEAPSCVSFPEALQAGITPINLGNPPAGAEHVAKFYAGILLGRLTRAILSREVTPETPPCIVVFEEFQEALSRDHIDQFCRLLALARYKRVSLWFLNQQPSQIATVSPHLLRVLRTNTDIQMCFNSNMDDAKAFRHALTVPAGVKERDVVAGITRLPKQVMYLWAKQVQCGAQKVNSPLLDLEKLKSMAASCPEETREAIRRGTLAVERGGGTIIAMPRAGDPAARATSPSADADGFPSLG